MALAEAMYGDSPGAQEGFERKLEDLRKQLAGLEPSVLELLLVERIVLCWVQVNHADMRFVTQQKSLTFEQAEYYMRRQDRALKRFLQACKALAQIRKLLRPNIQLNVAEKQINILEAVQSK